jgi:hypothetical protein
MVLHPSAALGGWRARVLHEEIRPAPELCVFTRSNILKAKNLILWTLLAMMWTAWAGATEIKIPPVAAKSGQSIDIPIMVNEVDNLAGVKLVMSYDPEILTYKKGMKTKETDSLMHIVNDKKPGSLILVMAGAKGIKGKDFSIFTLTFEVKKELKENCTTQISITESQLMGDDLKERKSTVVISPITILP